MSAPWRITVLFLTFLVVLFLGSPAKAQLLFADDFSGEHWETIWNAQLENPELPCRNANGTISWEYSQHQASLHITDSVPCKTVIAPKLFPFDWPRVVAISFTLYISNPEMDRNILLRWADENNYLGFHFYGASIEAEKFIAGQSYSLSPQRTYFEFQSHTVYAITMQYDQSSGVLQLFINGVLIYSGTEFPTDPQLREGGPGLAGSVGSNAHSYVWFENFRLENISQEIRKFVPIFKQDDPQWATETYDSAKEWAKEFPTLERWGCALTSAVMVLQAHGIAQLPNGQVLLPHTLNTWLIEQPDGYIYPGLVNWRALSRISVWHHEAFGTPKLEMSYVSTVDDPVDWIHARLAQNSIPILDVGGHFIVAHSYGPGSADIGIHDPLYAHQWLSAYDNNFISARVFTPSFTDLRAVSLYALPGTEVWKVSSEGKEKVQPFILFSLRDPKQILPQEKIWLYDFPKPQEDFTLEIVSHQPAQIFSLVSYNSQGELQTHKQFTLSAETVGWISLDGETLETTFGLPVNEAQALSREEFSWWLSWHDIGSPAVLQKIETVQINIQAQNTLSDSLNIFDSWKNEAKTFVESGRLSLTLQKELESVFYQLILSKFP